MNSYVIELKDGKPITIKADFIEISCGFFLFFRDNARAEVIKYLACDLIKQVTLKRIIDEGR